MQAFILPCVSCSLSSARRDQWSSKHSRCWNKWCLDHEYCSACGRLVDSPSHPLLLSSCNLSMSPKVLWNWPIMAMKRNSAHKVFGIISNFVMLISLPLVLLHKICLAAWCAGQCSMRCSMVLSCCRHAGHIGESAFPMH
ncbi:hypothetical protein L208DRAFT_1476855 [Tricholoma matsutake]|nr:hypothetical protein L208DRAFT_1476855 [Tricholoma matsutake 945]